MCDKALMGTAVIALVLSCVTTATSERQDIFVTSTLFVTPHNKSLCPSESENQYLGHATECYTINELIERSNIFGFSTVIYFLPGRHIVDEGISNKSALEVTTAHYIKLSGDYGHTNPSESFTANTTIECTKPFHFVFENVNSLDISRLNFMGCSGRKAIESQVRMHKPLTTVKQSIFIGPCTEVSINRVSILNGTGLGLTAVEVDRLHIQKLNLSHIRNTWDSVSITASLLLLFTHEACLVDVECTDTTQCFNFINSSVTLNRHVTITGYSGTAIAATSSELRFNDTVAIIANNIHGRDSEEISEDSVVYISDSAIQFGLTPSTNSTVRIENNTVSNCGGIKADEKSFLFFQRSSTVIFANNTGTNGGALALYDRSALMFDTSNVNVQFIANKARSKGGAIFVEDCGYILNKNLIIPITNCYYHAAPILHFMNNTAGVAGDEIYGGWIDWPYEAVYPLASNSRFCNNWFNHTRRDVDISSNPVRVCMCTDSTPNCTIFNHETWLYPGQTLGLEAVAVGQRFGTVPSTILAESKATLERGQNTQLVGRHCTPLQYTVMSSNKQEVISLHTERGLAIPALPVEASIRDKMHSMSPELETLFTQFSITVHLRECPLGYIFNTTQDKCTCHSTLVFYKITCNTTDYSVNRPQTKWINATSTHTLNGTDSGILVHNHCPFDYCYDKDNSIHLEHPEDQCDFNRSGILCGACQTKFSHVFGTSRCKRCSNLWVLLIVPTVILAGVALVVFLMVLDLTVSIGTINGLIFYANIVRANQPIFFPTKQTNTFLNIFIAWLNLDLGVETCFYDGLDAYTETWLQFVFPFYIWLLVTVIIVSSHYSTTASRWTGNNSVQVLATLFLLSYVKLLRLIITVFLSTVITYPDGFQRRVWLYDGNVDYLKEKHIPLFIAALLTLVIITIPYTTTVFGHQWLQRHRHCNRLLFWVRRLQPIFDAHTGPYKNNHRYWTGLLLLVRVTLLVTFTVNLSGDPSINLLAITITVLCLSMYFLFIGGPYKSKTKNLIEVFFYFNACFLSTTTLYKLKIESNSTAFTTTSTGISFVLFMLIVFYHVLQRITETRRGARLRDSIKERVMSFVKQSTPVLEIVTGQQVNNPEPVSHSSIELKEPLLVD